MDSTRTIFSKVSDSANYYGFHLFRYVEDIAKSDKKKAKRLITDDKTLFNELESIKKQMEEHETLFRLTFRCFKLVVDHFDTASMRSSLSELYDEVNQPKFFETDYFLKVIKLIRFFKVPKMTRVLDAIREYIMKHVDAYESLQSWYNSLDAILDTLTASAQQIKENEEDEEEKTNHVDPVLLHRIQVFLGQFFAYTQILSLFGD